MSNNIDPKIQEIRESIEFNYHWWFAAMEGEILCQPELEIVRELVQHATILLSKYEEIADVLEKIKQNEMLTYGEETGTYHIADSALSQLKNE